MGSAGLSEWELSWLSSYNHRRSGGCVTTRRLVGCPTQIATQPLRHRGGVVGRVTQQTVPIFLSESIHHTRTPDLSVTGYMKYCLQFNTDPSLIRPWMHAPIVTVEQEDETSLGHLGWAMINSQYFAAFTDGLHLAVTTSGVGKDIRHWQSTQLDSVHSTSLRTCVIMGSRKENKKRRESSLNGGRVRGDLTRHCYRRSGS